MQNPDATLVAGYNKWKDQFERHVKKGEHGITIIAPTPYKKKIEEHDFFYKLKRPASADRSFIFRYNYLLITTLRPSALSTVKCLSCLLYTSQRYRALYQSLHRAPQST